MHAEERSAVTPGLSSLLEEISGNPSYDCRPGNFDWLMLAFKMLPWHLARMLFMAIL
jgi:hypothetical protein